MSLIIDSLAKLAEKFSQKYPGEASGVATLDGSSKVVEDPGSAAYTKGGASGILGLDANARIATDQAFSTGGSDTHKAMGVIDLQFTPVGNVGAGEDDLMSYTLPANTLDADGKAIRIIAWGTGNNADSVRLKMYFGAVPRTIVNSAPTGQWYVTVIIVRTSAGNQGGGVHLVEDSLSSASAYLPAALTEDETAGIIIQFTGENITDASDDAVRQLGMIVEILN